MGADFMIYCCESPSDYARAMPLIEYRVESLDDKMLDSIADDILWYEAEEFNDEVSAEHNLKEEDLWKLSDLISIKIRLMVKKRIGEAIKELFGDPYRRDVAQVCLHNRCYLMTGGMSWGDLPTDACDMIHLIEYSGVTDGMSHPDFDYESFKA